MTNELILGIYVSSSRCSWVRSDRTSAISNSNAAHVRDERHSRHRLLGAMLVAGAADTLLLQVLGSSRLYLVGERLRRIRSYRSNARDVQDARPTPRRKPPEEGVACSTHVSQSSAVAYIVAAIFFIFGLKRLSSPATARSGNQLAALGMGLALAATLLDRQILSFWTIGVGTLLGAGIGTYFARTVQMTAMPQMVALFNGMGGATAALVSVAEYIRLPGLGIQAARERLQ